MEQEHKITEIVKYLREASSHQQVVGQELIIPDNDRGNKAEDKGFVSGTHNLSVLFRYLADMME